MKTRQDQLKKAKKRIAKMYRVLSRQIQEALDTHLRLARSNEYPRPTTAINEWQSREAALRDLRRSFKEECR